MVALDDLKCVFKPKQFCGSFPWFWDTVSKLFI